MNSILLANQWMAKLMYAEWLICSLMSILPHIFMISRLYVTTAVSVSSVDIPSNHQKLKVKFVKCIQ